MSKFYLIQMSRGESIPIDTEEIPNVLQGIKNKLPVMVKRGIFNPSFFVSVIEDVDRSNGFNRQLAPEKTIPTSREPLRDLFEGARSNLEKLIASGK